MADSNFPKHAGRLSRSPAVKWGANGSVKERAC